MSILPHNPSEPTLKNVDPGLECQCGRCAQLGDVWECEFCHQKAPDCRWDSGACPHCGKVNTPPQMFLAHASGYEKGVKHSVDTGHFVRFVWWGEWRCWDCGSSKS